MFVRCKYARKIKNFETGEVFKMPQEYLGEVPEWATKQDYFKACVADGTITFVGGGTDKEIYKAVDESEKKEAIKEEITKEKREEDREQANKPVKITKATKKK